MTKTYTAGACAMTPDRCSGSLSEVSRLAAHVNGVARVLIPCPICAKRVTPQDRDNLSRDGEPMLRVSNHR
jgi:hypothetical protein